MDILPYTVDMGRFSQGDRVVYEEGGVMFGATVVNTIPIPTAECVLIEYETDGGTVIKVVPSWQLREKRVWRIRKEAD